MTRAEFLYAIERRLKAWGFEGELWTDGTHLTIDGEVVVPTFKIGKIHEVIADLTPFSGLSPDVEIVAGISMEIALRLELVEDGSCRLCGGLYTAVRKRPDSDGVCGGCKQLRAGAG